MASLLQEGTQYTGKDAKMPNRSRLNLHQSFLRRRRKTPRHFWTDEELDLLTYYRSHNWTFRQIQKAHFPSVSVSGVKGAYARLNHPPTVPASIRASGNATHYHESAHSWTRGDEKAPENPTSGHERDRGSAQSITSSTSHYHFQKRKTADTQEEKKPYQINGSPMPSEHYSSPVANPGDSSNESDSEFFSAEEYLSSPSSPTPRSVDGLA